MTGRKVVVFCGRGNNGGDGLVVARCLGEMGGTLVLLVLVSDREAMTGDAAANLDLLVRIQQSDASSAIQIFQVSEIQPVDLIAAADFAVDALLGTGLTSALRQPILGLVEAIRRGAGCPVVSLDIPTGIDSDRGRIMGQAVKADLSVTMGSLKAGLLLGSGPEHAGKTHVAEIGIPRHVLKNQANERGCANLSTDEDVRAWLPSRTTSAHKYAVGMTLAVVGSRQYPGAGFLACKFSRPCWRGLCRVCYAPGCERRFSVPAR